MADTYVLTALTEQSTVNMELEYENGKAYKGPALMLDCEAMNPVNNKILPICVVLPPDVIFQFLQSMLTAEQLEAIDS